MHRLRSIVDLANDNTAYTLDAMGNRTLASTAIGGPVHRRHNGVDDARIRKSRKLSEPADTRRPGTLPHLQAIGRLQILAGLVIVSCGSIGLSTSDLLHTFFAWQVRLPLICPLPSITTGS